MIRGIFKGVYIALVVVSLCVPRISHAAETVDPETGNGVQIVTQKDAEQGGAGKARLFEWAIILVSLGAMGASACLHFLHAERKRMVSQIKQLEIFVATTCCIAISAQSDEDMEPIIEEIKKEETVQTNTLNAIQERETTLNEQYSELEATLTRLVGRA